MDDFITRAVIAGIGLAAFMGPLGVFVIWRRMAYFGETLAHSALLGVALGFLLGIDATTGIVAVCIAVALALTALRRRRLLADDALLGILSHSALSLGIVVIAFLQALRIDLMAYLFGDILAVTESDIAWIYAGGIVTLAILVALWRRLLAITVHEELAQVEGTAVAVTQLLFMLLIAITIALAMKLVGMLLVTSLLIIPAATARRFATSPERMALGAAAVGMLSVMLGLQGSLSWDLPAGPAIVLAAALLFTASTALPSLAFRATRRGSESA